MTIQIILLNWEDEHPSLFFHIKDLRGKGTSEVKRDMLQFKKMYSDAN